MVNSNTSEFNKVLSYDSSPMKEKQLKRNSKENEVPSLRAVISQTGIEFDTEEMMTASFPGTVQYKLNQLASEDASAASRMQAMTKELSVKTLCTYH
eukprot:CAMPEP_0178907666 /NCGR_PEP_ID=MMETSP0786-20121207/7497_1 /TAXON_ID=186022 /ORGANISM="Thalassionema frauenfeldii, Strain CCMP 1798" /LENGTH=96 /DNA_ID=CAMNT_0020579489 /DNA_START=81 /DNA_END=371 /DNA_ORIENTATION=+